MLGYIDGGTGSLILQALIAGVGGAVVAGRFYGRRLMRALRFRRGDD